MTLEKTPDLTQIPRPRGAEPADSLRGWSMALEEAKLPGLAPEEIRDLRRTMAERYMRLTEEGLLRHRVEVVSADQFLANPNQYLNRIEGEKLFPFVEPKAFDLTLDRWHNRPCSKSDMVEIAKGIIGIHDPRDYWVSLQRAYRILYTANVLVRADGDFIAEFSPGNFIPSRQGSPIAFTVRRDTFSNVFRYDTEDATERQLGHYITGFLLADGSGRNRHFEPAYYEVSVGVDPDSGRILPLFFDYRTDRFFLGS